MKIWKPLVKYKTNREEWAYHGDFALESKEVLTVFAAGHRILVESPPFGMEYKVHLEICLEPFKCKESK